MWGEIIRYAEVTSTNDLARDHARRGAAEGTVVIARHQVTGRGRQGRAWLGTPGKSLLMSLILRPPVALARSAWLTLGAGVAVAETMREQCDVPALVKWPNDVLVGDRKLAGVLTETHRLDGAPVAVVGIGANLGQVEADLGPELIGRATSVALAGGRVSVPDDLVESLVQRLREVYEELQRGAVPAVRRRWEGLDQTIGSMVAVEAGETTWRGRATRIDDQGALWVEDEAGEPRQVTAGEVSLRIER